MPVGCMKSSPQESSKKESHQAIDDGGYSQSGNKGHAVGQVLGSHARRVVTDLPASQTGHASAIKMCYARLVKELAAGGLKN